VTNVQKEITVKHDYFNPETYAVIDKVSGEEVDVKIFIEKASVSGWQKAYAKTLSEYIRCGDGKSVDFLAYVLEKKDHNNLLHGTQRELAEKTGVSLGVITRTMNALTKKRLIKKVRSGTYMVSPAMLRNGDNKKGALMLRLWGGIK